MSKLRAAVVGVGYLGRFHAQKYKAIADVDLVAVCDASAARAAEVAQELECAAETDYRNLIGKVDLVTVASSTPTHYEIAKTFLENGIHVNVEKPITTTSQQGEELCSLAEKNGLKLQVGHVERFNPAFEAAHKKMMVPWFIECHRLAPFKPRGVDVNVVLDLMIHDLDVILSLVDSEPVNIAAVGTPVITDTIDIANARIEFKSGAVANVTSSRVSTSAQRKFRVFQRDQYLSLDFGSGDVNLLTKTGQWQPDAELPIEHESWNLEKGDALLAETQSFVNSVLENKPCRVSGRDGLVALRLAEKIIGEIQSRLK